MDSSTRDTVSSNIYMYIICTPLYGATTTGGSARSTEQSAERGVAATDSAERERQVGIEQGHEDESPGCARRRVTRDDLHGLLRGVRGGVRRRFDRLGAARDHRVPRRRSRDSAVESPVRVHQHQVRNHPVRGDRRSVHQVRRDVHQHRGRVDADQPRPRRRVRRGLQRQASRHRRHQDRRRTR